MNFDEWIQEKIRDSGHTRKEIAKMAGIPKNQFDDICKGKEPSRYQVQRLSKILNIDSDEIFCIISEKIEVKIKPIKVNAEVDLSSKQSSNQNKNDYKTPLQPIIDKTCILTGKPNPERAHYTGIMQHLFGAGRSEKCDNLFVAEICQEKHIEFDQPKERKSLQASHDFMVAILLTIKRKVENGQILIK